MQNFVCIKLLTHVTSQLCGKARGTAGEVARGHTHRHNGHKKREEGQNWHTSTDSSGASIGGLGSHRAVVVQPELAQ